MTLILRIAEEMQNRKKSLRHLNFLKQVKKTTDMYSIESFSFSIHKGTQRVPRNTVKRANIPHMHITIINLGIASGPSFTFFPKSPWGS